MNTPHKIGFVSLGCPKATVDSEQVITQLKAEGYDIVPSYDEADTVSYQHLTAPTNHSA